MLLYLLGAGVAGWLAGESVRRGRTLGQRGLPLPPPKPFSGENWPDDQTLRVILLSKAHAILSRYKAELREAERRFDALEKAGASAETLRQAGAEAQDLAARVEAIEQQIYDESNDITTIVRFKLKNARATLSRYQAEIEKADRRYLALDEAEPRKEEAVEAARDVLYDLQDRVLDQERRIREYNIELWQLTTPPPPPPSDMPPPFFWKAPPGPIVSVPFEPVRRAAPPFVSTSMPKSAKVGPIISVAAETGRIPIPPAPARRTMSVDLAPTTGQMPFTGLGQRGLPLPPPQPFSEAPDWPQIPSFLGILIYKLNQAQADLARYRAQAHEAERRFDALEEANAPAEALREAGAEAQDLRARMEDAERRIDEYEGQLEDLAKSGEEAPAPPPVYQGVPIPPALPPPPLPWPQSLPEERTPIVSATFPGQRGMLAPSGMPRPGTVGPAVSVAAETAMPAATAPVRRTVGVPLAPAGGGIAFTGT